MNCMQALQAHLIKCEDCRVNSFIIEFEELPEDQKQRFMFYNASEHFLLHCRQCEVYKILPEQIERNLLV